MLNVRLHRSFDCDVCVCQIIIIFHDYSIYIFWNRNCDWFDVILNEYRMSTFAMQQYSVLITNYWSIFLFAVMPYFRHLLVILIFYEYYGFIHLKEFFLFNFVFFFCITTTIEINIIKVQKKNYFVVVIFEMILFVLFQRNMTI